MDTKYAPWNTKVKACFADSQPTFSAIVPPYYNSTSITPFQVIDDWRLNFRLGNVIKYIARHENKGNPLQDLQKALEYLTSEIKRLQDGNDNGKDLGTVPGQSSAAKASS